MITIEELNLIIKKYSLGQSICSIEQLTDGWVNLTCKFQIESQGKIYVLREYLPTYSRTIDINEIEFELDFLRYLAEKYHLPVVPPLKPPGIFVLSNQHYAAIFPFVSGRKYFNSERELWQIIEISRFLGRLHSIDMKDGFHRRTINIPDTKYQLVKSCDDFQREQPIIYERIRRILDEKTQCIPLIDDEIEQIQFEKDFETNLPKGFIHFDIHDDNVLFHPEFKQLAAVLDFDDMSYGPYLLDIAMSLCFWCLIEKEFRFDYAKIFLIEYQKVRQMNLTDDEWTHLELYCYLVFFHQLLFLIQTRECRQFKIEVFEELILPLEQIYSNSVFLKTIQ